MCLQRQLHLELGLAELTAVARKYAAALDRGVECVKQKNAVIEALRHRIGLQREHTRGLQQFISKLFPMGHIKSTYPKDSGFVEAFRKSAKWLRIRTESFAAIKA